MITTILAAALLLVLALAILFRRAVERDQQRDL